MAWRRAGGADAAGGCDRGQLHREIDIQYIYSPAKTSLEGLVTCLVVIHLRSCYNRCKFNGL